MRTAPPPAAPPGRSVKRRGRKRPTRGVRSKAGSADRRTPSGPGMQPPRRSEIAASKAEQHHRPGRRLGAVDLDIVDRAALDLSASPLRIRRPKRRPERDDSRRSQGRRTRPASLPRWRVRVTSGVPIALRNWRNSDLNTRRILAPGQREVASHCSGRQSPLRGDGINVETWTRLDLAHRPPRPIRHPTHTKTERYDQRMRGWSTKKSRSP